MEVNIPANASATVYVPVKDKEKKITENGAAIASVKGIEQLGFQDRFQVFKVGSGKYSFGISESFFAGLEGGVKK